MFKEIANHYDLIMQDFDYRGLVDYLDDLIIDADGERTDLLDLGCGTAEELIPFRELGYEVAGLDKSKEMLEIAREKHYLVDFYEADMTDFKLERTFDNAICIFDSLNYLTDKKKVLKFFKCVHKALNEDGLFLFDFNTAYGLIKDWAGINTESGEGFKIIYDSNFDYNTMISSTKIKTFIEQEDKSYKFIEELHVEKGYLLEDIKELLSQAGFKMLKGLPFLEKRASKKNIERYQVVARKK